MTTVGRRVVLKGAFWSAAAAFAATAAAKAGAGAGIASAPAEPGWMKDARLPAGVTLLPRIKLMVLISRQPDIGPEQFHRYWLEKHAPLALSIADEVRLQRYVQSHEVPSSVAAGFAGTRGWDANRFEGVTEGWWNSEADMIAGFSTPAGIAANDRLVEDERRFADRHCVAMITREYMIFDRDKVS